MPKHFKLVVDGKEETVVLLSDHQAEVTRAKESAVNDYKESDEYKEIVNSRKELQTEVTRSKYDSNEIVQQFNKHGAFGKRILKDVDWTQNEDSIKGQLKNLKKEYLSDQPKVRERIPSPSEPEIKNNPSEENNKNDKNSDLLIFDDEK